VPENQTTIPRGTPLKPRKRAILMGAAGGIGTQLAQRLAREGYVLALLDRNEDILKTLCDKINHEYKET